MIALTPAQTRDRVVAFRRIAARSPASCETGGGEPCRPATAAATCLASRRLPHPPGPLSVTTRLREHRDGAGQVAVATDERADRHDGCGRAGRGCRGAGRELRAAAPARAARAAAATGPDPAAPPARRAAGRRRAAHRRISPQPPARGRVSRPRLRATARRPPALRPRPPPHRRGLRRATPRPDVRAAGPAAAGQPRGPMHH